MVARIVALVIGAVLIIAGIAGLATAGDDLFGFLVTPTHDVVLLATGVLALAAGVIPGALGVYYSRLYSQVFGVAYGLLFIVGSFSDTLLGLFPVNFADTILHLVLAVVMLLVGYTAIGLYGTRPEERERRMRPAA